MPDLARPKIAAIYAATANWWQNAGNIHFIAHAITAGGAARLRPALAVGAGGNAGNHPDQVYWGMGGIEAVLEQHGAGIIRIEIDCTLMPCAAAPNCCLRRVPALVNNLRANTPLRFFSHRDENMGGGHTSTKRYFDCMSNDGHAALTTAYNGHGGWGWAPWEGAYP